MESDFFLATTLTAMSVCSESFVARTFGLGLSEMKVPGGPGVCPKLQGL